MSKNKNNEQKSMTEWLDYLNDKLALPDKAFITDNDDCSWLNNGDVVNIKSVDTIADPQGIIVIAYLSRKKIWFPLCLLEIVDKNSANYQLVEEYGTWFFNNR